MTDNKSSIREQRRQKAMESKIRRENELQEILSLLHKGLNCKQIAEEMNWPESSVISRLKQGTRERAF